MIKNITAGTGIDITNSYTSLPYFNMNSPSAGMVRYNGNAQAFEVYDGFDWKSIYGATPQVELNADVQNVLSWARRKMKEEYDLYVLCQKYPSLEKAKENFELVRQLVEQQE